MYGLGLDLKSVVGAAVASVTGTAKTSSGEAVPTPMELYDEAAPRVVTMLKQYDAAKPLIDFSTKNWWVLVIGLAVIAVGGSYVGNVIYHRVHRRK